VFVDIQMPVLDGLQATREICRRWPAENRPTVVGMTANAMSGDKCDALHAGMTDYLTKPVIPGAKSKVGWGSS
jgi:CheY-like chemotaxis protein